MAANASSSPPCAAASRWVKRSDGVSSVLPSIRRVYSGGVARRYPRRPPGSPSHGLNQTHEQDIGDQNREDRSHHAARRRAPDAFRAAFGVPDDQEPIGAIAIGYDAEPKVRDLRSRRRPLDQMVRYGQW